MSKLSRPILRLQHFRRMLISVLILLIPLVAIPVMWESRLQAENSQRLLAQYEKDFTRKTSALEHRMSVISALPSVLASNRTFQELVKSPFNAIQATAIRAELKTYCELNSDVAEIYLFVPAHDFIYSSHVLFPNGNSLIGTEIDASPLWDSLLDESNMNRYAHHAMSQLYYSFSDPLSVRSELCYQAPVFNSSSGVTMLAAVALNESLFSEYFASPAEIADDSPLFFYLDAQGNLLYANNPEIRAESLRDILAQNEEECVLPDTHLRYCVLRSEANGSVFLLLVNRDMLLAPPETAWPLFIVLTLIVAIAALCLFLYINYVPVYNIYSVARRFTGQMDSREIETIRDSIELLDSRVHEYSDKINKARHAQLRAFILDLMYGYYENDAASIDAQMTEFNLPIGCQYASLLINLADTAEFAGLMYPASLYFGGLIDGGLSVCLCALPEDNDEEDLREMLTTAIERLPLAPEEPLRICVGSLRRSLEDLPKSFMEVKTVAGVQETSGQSVILYKDIAALPAAKRRESALCDVALLNQLLASGDMEGAERLLEQFIQAFAQFELPMLEVRRTLFDIVNAIHSFVPAAALYLAQPHTLFEIHTQEEAAEYLSTIKGAFQALNTKKSFAVHPDMSEIARYIDAHYSDHDFSVRTLSERTNISFSYFSQLFKQEKGVSAIDYVITLRIQKAQELLSETDLSITEIVDQIGYYSVSSFIKRFRQKTGITPGKYRENHATHSPAP